MILILLFLTTTMMIFRRMPWFLIAAITGALLLSATYLVNDIPIFAWSIWVIGVSIFGIGPLRSVVLSQPTMGFAKSQLPELTSQEREAIAAGDVGLEADLIRGRPEWRQYMELNARLTDQEQAFLDGPVNTVCAMVDDWQVTHELADLPEDVWRYLKTEGFFGLVIAEEHGGKGFSAFAHSEVLVRLNSCSMTLGVSVSVPNSLGPGELLHRYGTEEQKAHYLPRLAKGDEIPCFALTSPDAGSDASAILDEGIVVEREIEGQITRGISLSFDKRYITLAPVATLVGLAFKLRDPDHLLGDQEDIGVTCALIPRDAPGMTIGRRHFPLNVPFQNGPIEGDDVFISFDQVIGAENGLGKGWAMLVECLSAGRGISLPSGSTGSAIAASMNAGAYARIRHQFGIPIAVMEGVKDSLANQVANTVVMDAARRLVACEIDRGKASGIAAAIVKYHVTERARDVVSGAMDVHGGKGIMLGPSNYLARSYQGLPIAITVEGANIMTRSLMIFGQGALRCHPYLLDELAAIEDDDQALWDKLLSQHLGWTVQNVVRAFYFGIYCGALAKVGSRAAYQTGLNRFSAALAVVTDVAVISLGASLKRRESLSARMGDLLSQLYLAAAVFSDSKYDYRSKDYSVAFRYIIDSVLRDCDHALDHLLRNWPSRLLGIALSIALRPLGRAHKGPRDSDGHALADLITMPTEFRKNFSRAVFTDARGGSTIGRLEEAMCDVLATEDLMSRLRSKLNLPKQYRRFDEVAARAHAEGLVSADERELLLKAHEGRIFAISVDDFDPSDLSRTVPSATTRRAVDQTPL